MTSEPDYETRAKLLQFTPLPEIKELLAQTDNTYVVDLRRPDEIESTGKVDHVHYVHTIGTPESCPALETSPEALLPNKDATIVLYCAHGRRAGKAKEILIQKGYDASKVHNAGGYADIQGIL